MNAFRIAANALLVTVLLSLTAASTQAAPWLAAKAESVGMSSERLGRIAPAMRAYIDEGLVPGTVTAIVRRGKLVHLETHGFRDVANKTPMERDTIFRIASMTKPITSVALMMLWEEGKFQLRDPVAKFLPEFAKVKVSSTADASGVTGKLLDPRRPMQVRDLLTHTAGLANNYRGTGIKHYQRVMKPRADDTLETFIKRLSTLPLNFHPGEAWEYSIATDVVGRLVEVISQQPLDEFMQTRIFDPLGMVDSKFYLDGERATRLAAQYKPGADKKIVLQDPAGVASRFVTGPQRLFRGAGGMVSTIDDYLRFQLMMLGGGVLDDARLLAPTTVSLMLANHTGDLPLWLPGPGMGFGLGYGVVVDRGAAATPLSLGAGYWGGAYCTLSWVDPEKELVAVIMTQVRPYTHLNIRQDFQALVYQSLVD